MRYHLKLKLLSSNFYTSFELYFTSLLKTICIWWVDYANLKISLVNLNLVDLT